MVEASKHYRPLLGGDREHYVYYPNAAEVGPGAALELYGRSFSTATSVNGRALVFGLIRAGKTGA